MTKYITSELDKQTIENDQKRKEEKEQVSSFSYFSTTT